MDKVFVIIAVVIFTFSSWQVHAATVADPTVNPTRVDPRSTERNPGPPALSPEETRQLQEQESKQLQGNQQDNGFGTVPLDAGGASTYPSSQPNQPSQTKPSQPNQDQNANKTPNGK